MNTFIISIQNDDKKEREICEFETDFENFFLLAFQSKKTCQKSTSRVSERGLKTGMDFSRPGLKTGVKNDIF